MEPTERDQLAERIVELLYAPTHYSTNNAARRDAANKIAELLAESRAAEVAGKTSTPREFAEEIAGVYYDTPEGVLSRVAEMIAARDAEPAPKPVTTWTGMPSSAGPSFTVTVTGQTFEEAWKEASTVLTPIDEFSTPKAAASWGWHKALATQDARIEAARKLLCECEYPYHGAQPIGVSRCEKCGKIADTELLRALGRKVEP
jgi:hypothetical protein